MKKETFLQLVDAHPELTATGYCPEEDENGKGTPEYQQRWNDERALLYTLYPQVLHCLKWFETEPSVLKKKLGSYHLKGLVEDWLAEQGIPDHYIPQGAFILAAIARDFTIKPCDDVTPNVFITKPKKGLNIHFYR